MFQQKTLMTGIIMLLISMALFIHANLTTYIDSEGILHETLSTPLSVFSFILAMLLIIIGGLRYFYQK